MSAAVLRIALRAMAWLVPAAHRARWREEWLAEVEFALSAGGARAGFRLAAGAASDVASLRGLAFRERLRWRGPSWMDVKLGIRMLIRYPGLAIISILSMAVAIAIGALSFTVMYGYMQPGVPLPDGDRLVAIDNWDTGTSEPERHALADVARWRRSVTSIAELGAYRDVRRNLIVPGGQIAPVQLAEITAAGLRMARVPPLLGRLLVDEDERKAAAPVLVIGYELWQTRFAADPWIVGRTVRLGGAVYTIVGVMPPGFAFPVNHAMWAALQENALTVGPRRGPAISIFGRLAPGVTIEDARAEMTAAGQRAAAEFPATHARLRPRVMPFTALYDPISGSEAARWQVHLIQSLFTLILVLVGANVAILVYARTATRMGEIAVRTALGASRARIVTQLFMEAAVLCAIAGTVGVILARVAMRALDTMLLSAGALPFWIRPGLSYGAVVYAGGLALLAALLAGVLPGLQATGARVQSGLRHFAAATGIRLGSTWTALIVAQVAIAVAVLPWIAYQAAVLGPYATFDAGAGAAGLLVARLAMDTDSHASSNGSAQPRDQDFIYTARQTELTSRLEREPGVSDVTFSLSPPGDERTAWVEIEGLGTPSDEPLDFAVRSGRPGHQVRMTRVGVNYFAALGVRILAGRAFEAADTSNRNADAIVVNRSFAETFFHGVPPLGRRLRYVGRSGDASPEDVPFNRWYEIVGVADDFPARRTDPGQAAATIYHPLAPGQRRPVTLVVRFDGGEAGAFTPRLRAVTAALDPELRLEEVHPLDTALRDEQSVVRLAVTAMLLVAASVLLLSGAGIYSLMSFSVARRRKEIGIRMALGADGARIVRAVFTRALRQIAMGVALGVVGAILLDRVSGGEVLHGRASILLPSVAIGMALVCGAATLVPTRRALRVQPTDALRSEV